MMKATLRSGVLLVGLLAWSIPSFAEVQNVKVGGDITVRGFHRSCLDLNCHTEGASPLDGHSNFLMSTIGLNVSADLTDNVSAFLRLANERDWNVATSASNESDVALSQGYVSLKELFHSPLSVKIGRQPIVWGRGFVLGSNLLPGTLARTNDLHSSITANEFTDFTAFDAIRATLDLSSLGGANLPLTADYVYIKLNEGLAGGSDDVTLQGINFSSHFDAWKTEAEAYYLNKLDKSKTNGLAVANNKTGNVNTLGIRGSVQPADGAYLFGELAYQFGQRAVDSAQIVSSGSTQQAWATDLGLEYTFKNIAMTPKVGSEWVFWSGKDRDGSLSGWDPIARGYFTTALREFQTQSSVTGFYPTTQTNVTSAATNQHQIGLYGSLKPLEDLMATSRLSFFWLDKGAIPTTGGKRHSYAGAEWDTQVLYNYTSDVQLGVLYALFGSGNIYRTPNDNSAQELVTTVSVKF